MARKDIWQRQREQEAKKQQDNLDEAVIEERRLQKLVLRCPVCQKELAYFSSLENIPEYYYCPSCNDKGYNENGEEILRLE